MTKEEKKKTHEQSGYVCYYCGKKLVPNHFTTTVDHIIPVSLGGTEEPENLVSCCVKCNSEKSSLLPSEWAKRIEWKIAETKQSIKRRQTMVKKLKAFSVIEPF